MYLQRTLDKELEIWSKEENRKPLIVRGARQVGKSEIVRNFSKQFSSFIEVNFDEKPELKEIFEQNLDPSSIVEKLSVLTKTPILEGETLLFIDEIQNCVPAISSLRYFYEKMPTLHVIAAGSLLEFVLAEVPSFAVGRVRSVFLYPFSFSEFLMAHNEYQLLDILENRHSDDDFPDIFHKKLVEYLQKFLIVGGMPEAVKTYIQSGNLLNVQKVLDDLLISIEADFVKYKKQNTNSKISEVFRAIAHQNGNKFSYSYTNSTLNNIQIKEILELLNMAGLTHFATHSACNGIPLGAEVNPKKRKMILFDTGILQRILNLDISKILITNDLKVINNGNIADLFVGLELIKNHSCYSRAELYYWQREAKNSQAEVDYVVQKQTSIIPIEVKAGTKGSMQSLYRFLEEKKSKFGIRTSLENFASMDKVKIIPIYALGITLYKNENTNFY